MIVCWKARAPIVVTVFGRSNAPASAKSPLNTSSPKVVRAFTGNLTEVRLGQVINAALPIEVTALSSLVSYFSLSFQPLKANVTSFRAGQPWKALAPRVVKAPGSSIEASLVPWKALSPIVAILFGISTVLSLPSTFTFSEFSGNVNDVRPEPANAPASMLVTLVLIVTVFSVLHPWKAFIGIDSATASVRSTLLTDPPT